MYVYVIRNSATGKVYIGQHKGTDLRKYLQIKFGQARYELKRKGKGGGSHLFASMRKHPKEVWSIEPLIEGIETRENLDRLERLLIALYDTQNPEIGYNICRGGEGFTGPHSPVAKAKVTAALKERWAQPGFKEHWSTIMTGRDVSSETVEKIKTARALQDEGTRLRAVRKWAEEHPEEMSSRMSREVHVAGGKAGSREAKQQAAKASVEGGSLVKALHVRWHVNRRKYIPECCLCRVLLAA